MKAAMGMTMSVRVTAVTVIVVGRYTEDLFQRVTSCAAALGLTVERGTSRVVGMQAIIVLKLLLNKVGLKRVGQELRNALPGIKVIVEPIRHEDRDGPSGASAGTRVKGSAHCLDRDPLPLLVDFLHTQGVHILTIDTRRFRPPGTLGEAMALRIDLVVRLPEKMAAHDFERAVGNLQLGTLPYWLGTPELSVA